MSEKEEDSPEHRFFRQELKLCRFKKLIDVEAIGIKKNLDGLQAMDENNGIKLDKTKVEALQAQGDKLTQDLLQELFKCKEALLEAALAYNAVASQVQQELVNLTFRAGCEYYAIYTHSLVPVPEPDLEHQ